MLSLKKHFTDVLVTDWNHFLYPSIVKWIKKNLDIAKVRYYGYSNQILPVP